MYFFYLYFQLYSHADLFKAEDEAEAGEAAKMNLYAAVGSLVAVTVVTAFCADYLVESIDEFSTRLGVPKVFIGIILLPIGTVILVFSQGAHLMVFSLSGKRCRTYNGCVDGSEGQNGNHARSRHRQLHPDCRWRRARPSPDRLGNGPRTDLVLRGKSHRNEAAQSTLSLTGMA